MKSFAIALFLLLSTSLAYSQALSLQLSGGSNLTLANKHEMEYEYRMTGVSTTGVITHTQHTVYEINFTPKTGAYLQAQLSYKLNSRWSLNYALGSSLQRFHKHVKVKESKISYDEGLEESSVTEPPVIIGEDLLKEPKLGGTHLWYLRHQLGASYNAPPRLSIYLSAWTNLLMQSAEYQMMLNYNYVSTGYQTNGATFRNAVTGLEAGIGYNILPWLEL